MLKDIIKRCAYFLNRDDIVKELDDADEIDEITDDKIKLEVLKLVDFFNIVSNSVFENYLELVFCEQILSNSDSQISFDRFSKIPVKVLNVETELGSTVNFSNNAFFVKVPSPKQLYSVTYRFVPGQLTELTDNTEFLPLIYQDIICYGILGEFLATISKFSESTYWKEKFTSELFKIKTRKERRVRSNYYL